MKHSKLDLHLGKADGLLLTLATVGVLVSSVLLLNDSLFNTLIGAENVAGAEKLGELNHPKRDVRRKLKSSLAWLNVQDSIDLYEGDTLFTGDDSGAVVKLDDNLTLEMDPNSLIILTKKNNEFVLNLKLGQIVASSNKTSSKKLTLVQKGKSANLKLGQSSSVKLAKTVDGKIDLVSNKGRFDIEAAGQKEQVNEAERVKVDEELNIEKLKTELKLTKPLDKAVLFLGSRQPLIRFQWLGSDKFRSYKVDVSTSIDFENVAYSFTTTAQQDVVNLKGLEGERLYWRVVANTKSGKAIDSFPKSFKLADKSAPVPLLPIYKSEFLLEKRDTAIVNFKWQPVEAAQDYQIQISNSGDFKKPLYSQTLSATELKNVSLKSGQYIWRVRAGHKKSRNFTAYSDFYSFVVKAKKSAPVEEAPEETNSVDIAELDAPATTPDPTALDPTLNKEDHLLESVENQFEKTLVKPLKPPVLAPFKEVQLQFNDLTVQGIEASQKAIKNPPILSWNPTEVGESYKVQVARDSQFKNLVFNEQTKKTSTVWKKVLVGNFYYRVAALNKEAGSSYEWSQLGKLKVRVPAPTVHEDKLVVKKYKSLKALNKNTEGLPISWDTVPMAEYYLLKINGRDLKKPVRGNKVKAPMKTKEENTLQVAVSDKRGRQFSEFSKPQKIKLEQHLLLRPPSLSFPVDGVSIVSFDDKENETIFSWSKISDAKKYEIQVSTDKGFDKIILTKTLESTSTTFDKKLQPGTYYWRVRSIWEKDHSPWSKAKSFGL